MRLEAAAWAPRLPRKRGNNEAGANVPARVAVLWKAALARGENGTACWSCGGGDQHSCASWGGSPHKSDLLGASSSNGSGRTNNTRRSATLSKMHGR